MNRCFLQGNVGNAPEARDAGNSRVATFSLATSRTWTNQSGEKQEKTEWHRCVAWNQGNNKLADVVTNYVLKGDRITVEGELEYRKWTDKDGIERTSAEIKVREVWLAAGKGDASQAPREAAPAQKAAATAAAKGASDFPDALLDEDDDLPFD
jgi:single-strand DNA-binding protein